MAETALDCLLESLNQIRKVEIGCLFSVVEMNQIGCLYEEVEFLRNSLTDLEKNRNEHEEIVKDELTEIRNVAYEAADFIDLSLVYHISQSCPETDRVPKGTGDEEIVLSHYLKQIKSLKKQVMKQINHISKKRRRTLGGIGDPQVGLSFDGSSSSRVSTALNVEEDTVVGFDHEAEMLKERLTGMSKQLQVISIIGMAGLGKTTLARKLYNDSLILHHFYIRGWTYVSQVYRKRDVLLGILSTVKDQISTESDEKLGEELYKCLKGKRYLVVLDDMWHIGAWNDLKRYFPNDNNGSKILFTSRCTDVVLHANHYDDDPPHYLRFLNEDESWDLLQKKIFWKESCPPDLIYIGKHIARKCQGLPLAIVVVAGLLAKTDKNQDWWKQVAENLSSYIVNDTEKCMDILALSYNSLPHHLKLCFLYFGAFPEDYEISVQKLIWLWIAEGFIHRIGHENKSVEDVAGDYLMDLINRNLVLVARKKSNGGISACRLHDLLHDLCVRKAKEENFLQQIYDYRKLSSSTSSSSSSSSSSLVQLVESAQRRRLCVNSCVFFHILPKQNSRLCAPHIRSLLCFVSESSLPTLPPNSFIYPSLKLLRVLDLLAVNYITFPSEIVQLFLLRYLALRNTLSLRIPASIGNLQNLEILIISEQWGSFIPGKLWNIATLRHLHIGGINYIDGATITVGSPSILVNLQTISHLCPTRNCQGLLARTLNLRKLSFCGSFGSPFWFLDLDFLNHLEDLKLLNRHIPFHHYHHRYNLQGVKFPPNLKSLTLSNTSFEWMEMSVLGMLPNLEVLKLKSDACMGSLWETSDGGFRRLKYLRLNFLNVEQWNTSSIHFPSLQHLVLHSCHRLEKIPSELGDIYTLHTIEVSHCSDSVGNSAVEIQKQQEDIGNDSLKIIIRRC